MTKKHTTHLKFHHYNEFLKPYLELETEEERQEYKRQHPELEKVMENKEVYTSKENNEISI